MQTMRDRIVARIERLGEGKAFSAKDFLDIASRTTIDVTLAQLALDGRIRRLRRGLYDMPKVNLSLGGKLSRTSTRRRARSPESNDGRSCPRALGRPISSASRLKYRPRSFTYRWPESGSADRTAHDSFKHARPKAMAGLEGKFALAVQALRHIGKESVGPREIETLRAALTPAEKRKLVKDTRFSVDWIYEVAKGSRRRPCERDRPYARRRARSGVRRNSGSQGAAGSHH